MKKSTYLPRCINNIEKWKKYISSSSETTVLHSKTKVSFSMALQNFLTKNGFRSWSAFQIWLVQIDYDLACIRILKSTNERGTILLILMVGLYFSRSQNEVF